MKIRKIKKLSLTIFIFAGLILFSVKYHFSYTNFLKNYSHTSRYQLNSYIDISIKDKEYIFKFRPYSNNFFTIYLPGLSVLSELYGSNEMSKVAKELSFKLHITMKDADLIIFDDYFDTSKKEFEYRFYNRGLPLNINNSNYQVSIKVLSPIENEKFNIAKVCTQTLVPKDADVKYIFYGYLMKLFLVLLIINVVLLGIKNRSIRK